MKKITTIIIIGALMYGVAYMQSASGARKANKEFSEAVQDAVYVVSASWSEDEAIEILTDKIIKAAKSHNIELHDNDIKIRYSRRESSGKEFQYSEYNKRTQTMEWGTKQMVTYYITARATVTYERKIKPFHTRRFKIIKVNKKVSG